MGASAAGAAGAAGAAAAVANAIKASGILVRVEPDQFGRILDRQQDPLVVVAEGGFFRSSFRYLTSYKGLAFYAESYERLDLPSRAEVVVADRIWIPG